MAKINIKPFIINLNNFDSEFEIFNENIENFKNSIHNLNIDMLGIYCPACISKNNLKTLTDNFKSFEKELSATRQLLANIIETYQNAKYIDLAEPCAETSKKPQSLADPAFATAEHASTDQAFATAEPASTDQASAAAEPETLEKSEKSEKSEKPKMPEMPRSPEDSI